MARTYRRRAQPRDESKTRSRVLEEDSRERDVDVSHFAHSGRDKTPARSDWQLLATHLEKVAGLAAKFAEPLRMGGRPLDTAAYAAGLLHDLGKYRQGFQRMIRGQPVPKESTYHKQAGAAYAIGLSKNHRA